MTFVTKKVSESICKVSEFLCENCNYITSVKSNFAKHCLTAKHKNVTSVTFRDTQSIDNGSKSLSCKKCNKVYKSRNGLWEHSKKCSPENKDDGSGENPPNLIVKLVQQNEHLQNLLMKESQEKTELIHKLIERDPGAASTSSTFNNCNNTTNNNNQKFNLNFFLNETCKDAMNIQEFMESLRITFQDLLKIGDDGFVAGVSEIFVKELQELEISKRPIHCTDSKREIIYLKENGEWNKDDKDKTKLKNIIEKVEYKNVAALQKWCNENPDSKVNNTDKNLLRDKIYLQTLQGDERTRDKIIKNISREVVIDKE